jgi:hypothetical protein
MVQLSRHVTRRIRGHVRMKDRVTTNRERAAMPNVRFVRLSLGGTIAAVAAALTLVAAGARAQGAGALSFEVRPAVGAFLPTGAQRDVLKDAASFGAQLGWRFHENFALAASFSWTPSRDRTTAFRSSALSTGGEERVDAFDYALGLEASLPVYVTPSWVVAPYVALGGGGRTYNYRDIDHFGSETTPVGYGSLGVDVVPPTGRLGVRVEVRDNVSGFKGLRGEYPYRTARNDVQVGGGITVRF